MKTESEVEKDLSAAGREWRRQAVDLERYSSLIEAGSSAAHNARRRRRAFVGIGGVVAAASLIGAVVYTHGSNERSEGEHETLKAVSTSAPALSQGIGAERNPDPCRTAMPTLIINGQRVTTDPGAPFRLRASSDTQAISVVADAGPGERIQRVALSVTAGTAAESAVARQSVTQALVSADSAQSVTASADTRGLLHGGSYNVNVEVVLTVLNPPPACSANVGWRTTVPAAIG